MILSITFWGLPTYCDLTRQSVCFIRRKWELSLMLIMASQLYSGASYWPTLLLHRQRKYTLITSVREGSRHRQRQTDRQTETDRQTDRDRHRQRKYKLISSVREGSRNLTWIGWLPTHLVLCRFERQWWWVVFVRLVKTSHPRQFGTHWVGTMYTLQLVQMMFTKI